MEASAQAMTVSALFEDGGAAWAHCLGCNQWRELQLGRMSLKVRTMTWGQVGRRLRCDICRRRPIWLRVADRYHHDSTWRV